MRLYGPALAIACLLPVAASAQSRLGGLMAPQIPSAVARIPQAPAVPQVPSAPALPSIPSAPTLPQVPSAPALPPSRVTAAAIPSGARMTPPTVPDLSAALSAIAHGPVVAAVGQALPNTLPSTSAVQSSLNTRLQRLTARARAAPEALEMDRQGELVLRGRVLATDADSGALEDARRLGFEAVEHVRLAGLGVDLTVLRAPAGVAIDDALAQLRQADPKGAFDADSVYETAGSAEAPAALPDGKAARRGKPIDIGLVDSGVAADHPALARSLIVQQGFAAGGLTPGEHGTAIASLISGEAAGYQGVAPRSTLRVADVYGSGPGGGSASAVAKAIDWLVRERTPVINISLVGAANPLLEKAIDAAVDKGAVVVAAVGNDGPFSPPLYPAAYRNVVAVTGVDRRDMILAEAVRATPVAFAAPGADILAARLSGGFEEVRGTSFAAPIVAAEIAQEHRKLDRRDAVKALAQLQHRAVKAANAKPATAYGWGVVGEDLRPGLTAPAASRALAELGGK